MTLTQEVLKSLLSYDDDSGDFYWLKTFSRTAKAGGRAGTVTKGGYLAIGIARRYYKAHRLAWLFVYGHIPIIGIDHIDRNKLNNSIANLRLADQSQNQANRGMNCNNKTGYRGVSYHRRLKKFHASVRVDFKYRHLGYFNTAEDAGMAADKARRDAFGPFAAQYQMLTPNKERVS